MRIEVRGDVKDLELTLAGLRNNGALAVARALNRTIQTVRTEATRSVAANVGLAQRDVRAAMRVERATRHRLQAALEISGRRIPLLAFKARQTRAGVSYRLPGGRSLAPSAFIATMRSGHRGVFRRGSNIYPPARRGPKPNRAWLPIVELFGPSLPRVFSRAAITRALQTLARTAFRKNLTHELQFLRQGRSGGSAAAA